MINSRPNKPEKYDQGLFIPRNKDKVIKLNELGGLYYRSSLEKKIMIWLDNKNNIIRWGAECIKIPYEIINFNNNEKKITYHYYYPDFYYEIKLENNKIDRVIAEVKSNKEYLNVLKLKEGSLMPKDVSVKELKKFEYDYKTAYKNKKKWESVIAWCEKMGCKFIVITDEVMNKKIKNKDF